MCFFSVSQVFKDLDFLGWYTTGNIANETDLKVHQQVCFVLFYFSYILFHNLIELFIHK